MTTLRDAAKVAVKAWNKYDGSIAQLGSILAIMRDLSIAIDADRNPAADKAPAEPVAHGVRNKKGAIAFVTLYPDEYPKEKFEPLYAAPPLRELSERAISDLAALVMSDCGVSIDNDRLFDRIKDRIIAAAREVK